MEGVEVVALPSIECRNGSIVLLPHLTLASLEFKPPHTSADPHFPRVQGAVPGDRAGGQGEGAAGAEQGARRVDLGLGAHGSISRGERDVPLPPPWLRAYTFMPTL